MRLNSINVMAIAVASLSAADGKAAGSPRWIYTLDPPVEIRESLARLKDDAQPAEAIRSLAARDDAAPYLRMELAAAKDRRVRRDLAVALGEIENRSYSRNMKRAGWWIATRRIDLAAEFLSGCQDRDAIEVADRLLVVCSDLRNEAAGQLGRPTTDGPAFAFKRVAAFPHFSGADVTVPAKTSIGPVMIRAGDCTLEVWDRTGYVVAVSGELADPFTPQKMRIGSVGKWLASTALVNTAMPLAKCEDSLIVCAEDIELLSFVNGSVLIAGGSIRSGKTVGSVSRSHLCAGGDVVLPQSRLEDIYIHSGGTVTLGKPFGTHENLKEKQKSLPFGIRFVGPADFGLDVAVQNGGVQVMKIAPESPFAKYGVKDGDIITAIDDATADSLSAFRRQIRRGVLRESVVLLIRRGNERITRIVFLDGIPLPQAPAPREATVKLQRGDKTETVKVALPE